MENTTTFGVEMFQPLIESITSNISPGTLIAIIGAVIGATVVFRMMWWGVGYVQAKLWPAIQNRFKGKKGG